MADEPERDEADKRIERLQAQLEEEAGRLITDAPHPGPMPEVLQKGPSLPPPGSSRPSEVAGMAKAWAVALDFIFTIIAGAGVGWLVDRWQNWSPAGLLVGLGLGFVFAFWRIIRATQRQEAAERRNRGRA